MAGRRLHWLIAGLAMAALGSGYVLTWPDAYSASLLRIHLAFGVSAGLLSLARVLVWLTAGAPPPAFEPGSRLQARLAKGVHVLLRLVPLLLFVSGVGMLALSGSFGAVARGTLTGLAPYQDLPPRNLHHAAAFLLAGLIGLHGLAAFWHRLNLPGLKAG
ncbi:cytochrome b [Roseibium sediminicola]|uniref:Cytochrome b/b6 domain-containing protein n=1 Tax=Roseibium sediminicola TaxID=2933272 RepID=A0ABT0GSN4_9HYPH|nr:cytochrome b/b6 domain-containing protein [Roseibium sp. CAU 1639]MCK7612454.1 cytochrome b/b6 domain-containing protein [Roseibium sp. CAU 1639]